MKEREQIGWTVIIIGSQKWAEPVGVRGRGQSDEKLGEVPGVIEDGVTFSSGKTDGF